MQKLLEIAKQKGHPENRTVYFAEAKHYRFFLRKDDITVDKY